jgi:type III secretion system FlhB-like substrate exporter
MVILQNNAAAQEVLTKALTFIPLVSAVSVVFNILAIVLLYTSKLPVRRYRVVTSIFLFIVNIVILIYFLAGGQGA